MKQKLIPLLTVVLVIVWVIMLWKLYVTDQAQSALWFATSLMVGSIFTVVNLSSNSLLNRIMPFFNSIVSIFIVVLVILSIIQRGNPLFDMVVLAVGTGFIPPAVKRLGDFEITLWWNRE